MPLTRSEIMSRIRSVSEMERNARQAVNMAVRRLFYSGCPRMYHQPKGLEKYGRPDYANKAWKVMVFVHGRFWHGYGYPSRFRMPKTNVEFWRKKIERNRARHRQVVRRARRDGWTVLTVWDFQLRRLK